MCWSIIEKLKNQDFNGRTISASVSSPHNINNGDSYCQSKSLDDEVCIFSLLFNLVIY